MFRYLDLGIVFLFHLTHSMSYTPHIFAEWNLVNYTWDSSHSYDNYVNNDDFIVENCIITGVNVDVNGFIYVSVPRWRAGVPATLNKLVFVDDEYVLSPYPSWDLNSVGTAEGLQNVQSMTIDEDQKMWVIEVGRRNFFDSDPLAVVNNPAGIWLIDLKSDKVISKYYFPEDIVSYTSSFINDIVLDQSRQCMYTVYIMTTNFY